MGAKVWIGMAFAACTGLALAGGPSEVRKQTEVSMLVTGAIVIEPDGHVGSCQADQAEELPPAATRWMAKAAPWMHRWGPMRWRAAGFTPLARDLSC